MKRVMTAALMLSLLSGTAAFAQPGERGHDRRDDRQEARQDRRGDRQEARQDRREDRQDARQERRGDRQEARQDRREDRQDGRQDRQDGRQDRRDGRQDRRDDRAVPPPQRGSPGNPAVAESLRRQHEEARRRDGDRDRGDRGDRRPDYRGDRDNDRRGGWERSYRPGAGHYARDRDRGRRWYNADQWRRSYHAPRRYRAPSYHRPSGWYVRTWSFGDTLPWGWFNPSYYLDWRYYGLPIPPIGAEWVRVGDDALLVDVWSGRVLTVYYDLFW